MNLFFLIVRTEKKFAPHGLERSADEPSKGAVIVLQ
jgi:hypothetical protein